MLLQQAVSMIICDKRKKTEESAWLINRDTIFYVLIAERKKGQFKAYGTFLLSHILIAGDNIFGGVGRGLFS